MRQREITNLLNKMVDALQTDIENAKKDGDKKLLERFLYCIKMAQDLRAAIESTLPGKNN